MNCESKNVNEKGKGKLKEDKPNSHARRNAARRGGLRRGKKISFRIDDENFYGRYIILF